MHTDRGIYIYIFFSYISYQKAVFLSCFTLNIAFKSYAFKSMYAIKFVKKCEFYNNLRE